MGNNNSREQNDNDKMQGLLNDTDNAKGKRSKMHHPTPMTTEEIFDLYTKMIEEDFAFNQNQYMKKTNNEQSGFANVTGRFVEIENEIKNPDSALMKTSELGASNTNIAGLVDNLSNNSGSFMRQGGPKKNGKLQYTLIGMCFVNEKCIDQIQQLKEDVEKKIKHFPSSNDAEDTKWEKMFVVYITLQEKDIDMRLQKGLLKEMQLMLDGGFGDLQILDSTRYRQLYIAQVYENQDNERIDENQLSQYEKIAIDIPTNQLQFDGSKEHSLIVDRIGISQVHFNYKFYMIFKTIESHLNNKKTWGSKEVISTSGHPVMRIIQRFQKDLQQILSTKIENEIFSIKTRSAVNETPPSYDNGLAGTIGSREGLPKVEEMEGKNFHDVLDKDASEIFKWHLDRAVGQINSFAKIIQDVITVIYGDFQQLLNYQNCMFNLMVSEILKQKIKEQ